MYTVKDQCLHGLTILSMLTALSACMSSVAADTHSFPVPRLGRTPPPGYIDTQPIHAFADGRGLPSGFGTAEDGAEIYQTLCASCHGRQGQGGSALELVGDRALLATEFPDKGIAVYWPYAPPLFEYIRRAMPPDKPWSLGVNETYSLIAYLFSLSELVTAEQVVDASFLSDLVMPNRGGFNSLVPE